MAFPRSSFSDETRPNPKNFINYSSTFKTVKAVKDIVSAEVWEYVENSPLGVIIKEAIPPAKAKLLMDLEIFEQYPWGRVAFVEHVNQIKTKTESGDIKQGCYLCKAFVQVIQIWPYAYIPYLGEAIGRPIRSNGLCLLRFKVHPVWEHQNEDPEIDNLLEFLRQEKSLSTITWKALPEYPLTPIKCNKRRRVASQQKSKKSKKLASREQENVGDGGENSGYIAENEDQVESDDDEGKYFILRRQTPERLFSMERPDVGTLQNLTSRIATLEQMDPFVHLVKRVIRLEENARIPNLSLEPTLAGELNPSMGVVAGRARPARESARRQAQPQHGCARRASSTSTRVSSPASSTPAWVCSPSELNQHADQPARFSEDQIRLCYLAILTGGLLGLDRREAIPTAKAQLLMDLEIFEQYPWGRVAFVELFNQIKTKTESGDIKQGCYVCKAFVQVIQIWAYAYIPCLGEAIGRPIRSNGVCLLRFKGENGKLPLGNILQNAKVTCMCPRIMNEVHPVWEHQDNDPEIDNLLEFLRQEKSLSTITWQALSEYPLTPIKCNNRRRVASQGKSKKSKKLASREQENVGDGGENSGDIAENKDQVESDDDEGKYFIQRRQSVRHLFQELTERVEAVEKLINSGTVSAIFQSPTGITIDNLASRVTQLEEIYQVKIPEHDRFSNTKLPAKPAIPEKLEGSIGETTAQGIGGPQIPEKEEEKKEDKPVVEVHKHRSRHRRGPGRCGRRHRCLRV
ncbi:hypothetical protein Bca4012_020345 [Brassica carinata]